MILKTLLFYNYNNIKITFISMINIYSLLIIVMYNI